MRTFRSFRPLLLVSLALWAALAPAQTAPAPAAPAGNVALPETDDVIPGAGPLRRADWFRNLWRERRQTFADRVARDQGAVVFLGDSITQGWHDDLSGAFGDLAVANRGISGDTSRGVLYRLPEDVITLQPRAVVLLIGTNDIEEGAAPDTIAGNVRLIIEQLRQHNPRLPILLNEVFPSSQEKRRPATTIQPLNTLYAQIARDYPQVTLVESWAPFANAQGDAKLEEFPDLLHPNAAGYAKWAEVLRPVLEQALQRR